MTRLRLSSRTIRPLLKEAQTDLARYQTLVAENSIAAQKAADQAFTVQQDEGTVKLDEANVETAKLNLNTPISTRPRPA